MRHKLQPLRPNPSQQNREDYSAETNSSLQHMAEQQHTAESQSAPRYTLWHDTALGWKSSTIKWQLFRKQDDGETVLEALVQHWCDCNGFKLFHLLHFPGRLVLKCSKKNPKKNKTTQQCSIQHIRRVLFSTGLKRCYLHPQHSARSLNPLQTRCTLTLLA